MRVLSSIPNTKAPDTDYPSGAIQNKDLTTNPVTVGTPIIEQIYGDVIQFFWKLVRDAGITPNDLADNTSNGFQLFTAFETYVNTNMGLDDLQAAVGDASSGLVKDVDDLQAAVGDLQGVANTSTEKAFIDFITNANGQGPQLIIITNASPTGTAETTFDVMDLNTLNITNVVINVPDGYQGYLRLEVLTGDSPASFSISCGGIIYSTDETLSQGDLWFWSTVGYNFAVKLR